MIFVKISMHLNLNMSSFQIIKIDILTKDNSH